MIFCVLLLAFTSPPDPIDTALAVQKAMADARDHLQAGDPASAAAALESQLPHANVNRAYLDLLSKAYHGELAKLRQATTPDTKRIETINQRLAILTGEKAVAPPAKLPSPSYLVDAARYFHAGKQDPANYALAAQAFAKAEAAGESLSADHKSAWAYCKLKLAAEKANADPKAIPQAAGEIQQAIAIAPDHAAIRQTGAKLLEGMTPSSDKGFKITNGGMNSAAILAEAARQRELICQRWFGPAGPAWSPPCELVIHATANDYAKATKLSASSTGHAEVQLENGQVVGRRIDLRLDDTGLLAVSLPRELAHVVLADVFPVKPPPRWAEEGMAILSAGDREAARFRDAIPRLVADGAMPKASEIFRSTGFPAADKITGFYVGSVTLTDYLVRMNGEKAFTAFLTDAQRYGLETALKRQYKLTPEQLDAIWKTR